MCLQLWREANQDKKYQWEGCFREGGQGKNVKGEAKGSGACRNWVSHGDTQGKNVPGKYNHKR